MQISGIAPTAARTDVPGAPATREDAAKALAAVPNAIAVVATMSAMTKSMAGETASRADLVAPMLEKMTIEQAKMTLLNAIDGAIAVMPELADRNELLRQAAAGIETLLQLIVADTTQADAQVSLGGIMTPLQPLMTPVLEAVLLLDPSFGKDQGEPPTQG